LPPYTISVTRRAVFSAARSLRSGALDEDGNARLFGPERNLHGHDFTLLVTLVGEAPPETGMVMDLKALSRLIRAEVTAPLDRTLLDGAAMLEGLPPTTENLARAIWRRLAPNLKPGSLHEVALLEGSGKGVRYRGE
jgi:6-pyruvoyltetrahydropterin/6-carboxytetrahydropterin synthase